MSKFPTGDQGQRYEIRAIQSGEEVVIGWCERRPEKLVEAAKAHPACSDAWHVDRKPKGKKT